jgi:hypothetical protein
LPISEVDSPTAWTEAILNNPVAVEEMSKIRRKRKVNFLALTLKFECGLIFNRPLPYPHIAYPKPLPMLLIMFIPKCPLLSVI